MKTIEEYIAYEMSGEIVKKAKSPFVGIIVLLVGIALLVLVRNVTLADALMAASLTVGLIATGVGIVLTAMSLTGALSRYVYKPTHSPMKQRRIYLGNDDYRRCLDAIGSGAIGELGKLQPLTSSNSTLRMMYSRDMQVALLQAGRDDMGHYDPETPVVKLVGTDVAAIKPLCR